MRGAIVFDDVRPWLHLLPWFLLDAGETVERTCSVTETARAVRNHPDWPVVLNSACGPADLERTVAGLRRLTPEATLVGLRHGPHDPGEPELDITVCVHGANDAETVVEEIRRILAHGP